ncbi:MAG: MoaD/ThiS family protein [Dehalococcoidales bacterium]|nr:MoaD/ThiS family protein [Dehalococcoidales bacterium]
MSIAVNIPPFLQTLADGMKQIDVSGDTVGECLDELVKRYPRLKDRVFTGVGKIHKGFNIFINGESASPDVLAKPVEDGDIIHIAHPIFGG